MKLAHAFGHRGFGTRRYAARRIRLVKLSLGVDHMDGNGGFAKRVARA
ncbi:MAG TPA: hypothetical protein VNI53_07670 [Gammaproteobacteria bacterium]|nr:hypothetical protein [Gammaproteobacteria bacterium]